MLGRNGRVEKLEATIRKRHLRPRPKPGDKPKKTHSKRVERFVKSLGAVDTVYIGIREKDEVGHLVGDQLSGPKDKTYNFIPQSPQCNMQYLWKVENKIYEYLEQGDEDDYAVLRVEMVYIDNFKGLSPDRPTMLKVHVVFSNREKITIELSNM